MQQTGLKAQLCDLARASCWFYPALMAVRALNLDSWCIGAGAIRTLVWDSLHERSVPSELPDLDVAYFDTSDLSATQDVTMQRRLSEMLPGMPWEVTNQAAVHTWFESVFGYSVAPVVSLDNAVSTWPEYATAVGLTLDSNDRIDVIAPYGLDDLFSMTVRWNPARVSREIYAKRLVEKDYLTRWPKVTIVPP